MFAVGQFSGVHFAINIGIGYNFMPHVSDPIPILKNKADPIIGATLICMIGMYIRERTIIIVVTYKVIYRGNISN